MATAVVSGRVDEGLRDRAARFIEAQGLTVGDVIKNVWETIALTGEVPLSPSQSTAEDDRRKKFEDFVSFVDALPPCSEETADMDERQMRGLVASRHV